MLHWRTPQITDIKPLQRYMQEAQMMASDAAPANIFLLRNKYDIKIAESDGFLFRQYSCEHYLGRNGYTCPLGKGNFASAVDILQEDCKVRNTPLDFIFLTENQASALSACGIFTDFMSHDGNSDYVYSAEHLSLLSAAADQKKRNRLSHFTRTFPHTQTVIVNECLDKYCQDIMAIEEQWYTACPEQTVSVAGERESIMEACRQWQKLGLIGIIVYNSDQHPIAMSIASQISPGCFDIHYEKCYGEYAQAGGYAYVNQQFAAYLSSHCQAKWLNREEDLGIPGLRRAKMNYHPDLLLQKFHCHVANQ